MSDLLYGRDTAVSYAMLIAAVALIGMFGFTAWALRREQVARKGWVIVAALLNVLLSMGTLLLYGWIRVQGFAVRPGVFTHSGRLATIPLIFGITGLLVFPRNRGVGAVT